MSVPTISAWAKHQQPVDETVFTPWADKGWNAWNGQSPEVEVCMFVQSLVSMMQPKLVIETGVGQGYMTRSIVPVLDEQQLLIAFESDDKWRAALWVLPFWSQNNHVVRISDHPTPTPELLSRADLCVFDSEWATRFTEIDLWHQHAKAGAVSVIHDTGEQPETIHSNLRELVVELGIAGFFLRNPRGCFVAVQT